MIQGFASQRRGSRVIGMALAVALPAVAHTVVAADDVVVRQKGPVGSYTTQGSANVDPNACKSGFVWRLARSSDLVCVTPEARARTAQENADAADRIDLNGAYGPNTCVPGYVWRQAFEGDLVCVTPAVRRIVRQENAQAASRLANAGSKSTVATSKANQVTPSDVVDVQSTGAKRRLSKVTPAYVMKPEHKRPGQHTLALDVGLSMPRWSLKSWRAAPVVGTFTGEGVSCVGPDESPVPLSEFPGLMNGQVGWGQAEWGDSRCMAFVLQLAVLFDTQPLDDVPVKTIERAVLSYEEAAGPICALVYGDDSFACWKSGEGTAEAKPDGCVVVRIPAVNWPNGAQPGLLAYASQRPTVRRISTRQWDVTEAFRWQSVPTSAPLGAKPSFGFLLSGGPSLSQLTADDNTVCVSALSEIKLHVTYTVPPEDEPFRDPK